MPPNNDFSINVSNSPNPNTLFPPPVTTYSGAFNFSVNPQQGQETIDLVLSSSHFDRDFSIQIMLDQNIGETPSNYISTSGPNFEFETLFSVIQKVLRFSRQPNGNIGCYAYDTSFYIDPEYADINNDYSSSDPLLPFLYYTFTPKRQTSNKTTIDIFPMLKNIVQTYFYVKFLQIQSPSTPDIVTAERLDSRESYDDFGSQMILSIRSAKSFPQNSCISFSAMFTTRNVYNVFHIDGWQGLNFTLQLIVLPTVPMTIRPGDRRVGYYSKQKTPKNGPSEPIFAINRIRLSTTSKFKVYVTPNNPTYTYPLYQNIINQYNAVFNTCGYTNPLELVTQNMPSWPADFDFHDIRYSGFTIVDASEPYAGAATITTDYRTGEAIQFWAALNINAGVIGSQFYKINDIFGSAYQNGHGWCCPTAIPLPLPTVEQSDINMSVLAIQLHEFGHCLGLQHNFAGSYENDNSIMDYDSGFTLDIGETTISRNQVVTLGAYDVYALRYGYQILPSEDITYLNNLANGDPFNGPAGPPNNPLYVGELSVFYGSDYRSAPFDYGTGPDRARKFLKISAIIKDSWFNAFLNGVVSKEQFSSIWLNRVLLQLPRAMRMLIPYIAATIPTQDTEAFLFAPYVDQFTAIDSMLNITDETNLGVPVGLELFFLSNYDKLFSRLSWPDSELFGFNDSTVNRRLNFSTVRGIVLKSFFYSLWSYDTVERMTIYESFGPFGMADFLFRLMLSPGTAYGSTVVDVGIPIFLNDLPWAQIDTGVYMENVGLFPELNAIFVNFDPADLGTIISGVTSSEISRQRRETFLSTLVNAAVLGQIESVSFIDMMLFLVGQLYQLYTSVTLNNAIAAVPISFVANGHLQSIINLCAVFLGSVVSGTIPGGIGSEFPTTARMSAMQMVAREIRDPIDLSAMEPVVPSDLPRLRTISTDGYVGLSKEAAIARFNTVEVAGLRLKQFS